MEEKVHCEERDKIAFWVSMALDGRLGPEHESEMERHLASCAACRANADAIRHVSALLSDEPMIGPSYGFSVRVGRRLAERTTRRHRLFHGVALLTSSLSLVGAGAVAILILGLGLAAMLWFGSQPAGQQVGLSVAQVASGLGLMGKGASLFLKEILLRYGLPVVLVVGGALAIMAVAWVWIFAHKSNETRRDGYA